MNKKFVAKTTAFIVYINKNQESFTYRCPTLAQTIAKKNDKQQPNKLKN